MPWAYAGSRFALILRRLRGRFGVSAPQVSVRTQVPWYLRLLVGGMAVVGLFLVSDWAYDAGRRVAGFDQMETAEILQDLRSRNIAQEEEVSRLRSLLTASESSLQIERAAQRLLSEKYNALVSENNRLREDLAVFERLTKLEGKQREAEVGLDQLSVRADGGKGGYRYGFLIALQGGRRGKDAKFNLQIVVTPRGEGGGAKILFPRPDEKDLAQYDITMRNFRRIEGRFALPAGVIPAIVEFRILEAGMLRASSNINM